MQPRDAHRAGEVFGRTGVDPVDARALDVHGGLNEGGALSDFLLRAPVSAIDHRPQVNLVIRLARESGVYE